MGNGLDGRTLLFATAMLMPIMSWVIFTLRRSVSVSGRGLAAYAGANILLTSGTILLGLRGSIPLWASLVGGNAMVMFATSMYYFAVRRFDGSSWPAGWIAAVAASAVGLMAHVMIFAPPAAYPIVPTAWMACFCLAAAASLLLRAPDGRRSQNRWFCLSSFAGVAAANALRCFEVLSLAGGAATGLFDGAASGTALYLAAALCGLSCSVGFILMISDVIQERLLFLATHDALTGARSRGSFMDVASHELSRSQRTGKGVVLLMSDIDHFKVVNDSFGHPVGDQALRDFAAIAAKTFRRDDIFGRYGGEEFIALLPNTSLPDALKVAERLRLAVGAHPVATARGPHPITVSIGVATSDALGLSMATLIEAADRALYESKRAGRNRVSVAMAPASPTELQK